MFFFKYFCGIRFESKFLVLLYNWRTSALYLKLFFFTFCIQKPYDYFENDLCCTARPMKPYELATLAFNQSLQSPYGKMTRTIQDWYTGVHMVCTPKALQTYC